MKEDDHRAVNGDNIQSVRANTSTEHIDFSLPRPPLEARQFSSNQQSKSTDCFSDCKRRGSEAAKAEESTTGGDVSGKRK